MVKTDSSILKLPIAEIETLLRDILQQRGFATDAAIRLAETFTANTVDGVYTHGLDRFPRFIALLDAGHVKIEAQPHRKTALGAIEQWDGQLGAGILNALEMTDRAIVLARQSGIGCVGLANTNHWLRGGTYGWRAAKEGMIFIGWTNTIANMPAWGAKDSKLGNNPLVLAVPYQNEAIVLDMAQSQFSYGAMESAQRRGEQLPVMGGYDFEGKFTADPEKILGTQLALPVGFWKGAGLSLLLDILATLIAGGRSTAEITKQGSEYGVSQVFIAIDPQQLGDAAVLPRLVEDIIQDYLQSEPAHAEAAVRYPGEGALRHRHENRRAGVPVDQQIWAEINTLLL